jgi:hypothetical protein
MAFNGGFPATYQPMYYQPQYQTVQPSYVQQNQQPQQSNGIIWVQGEAGAKSYLVAPNTTVQLWDSEAQVIYLKSADASGMPSMKILDYTIRDMTPANGPVAASPAPTINAQDYALRTDLDALAAQITAIKAQIEKKGANVDE